MANFKRKYPLSRLRRLRANKSIRNLVAENKLSVDDLIQPIFVKESLKEKEEIESLPGIFRHSDKSILKEVEELLSLGIKAVAIFPVIDEDKKDEEGSEAINENNFLNNIIKTIKQNFPEILVVADVALDPYTIHGHDGVLNSDGDVDNDRTLKILEDQALKLALAGTDIIAPSDMMDGRVGVIRKALEEKGFKNTMILAYSAKYSSKFYGPFKEAVESAKFFGNKTKDSYQMAVANIDEALHEVALDINEGADIVMVKPGMPYLDVVKAVKEKFQMPTFVYQVSGEYAMLKAAIEKNWLSEEVIFESLLSFKRAGADCILTYAAKEIAKNL
ncbi:MAG: delta-aminolevulinic acid dehydratase [Gammaproteobacteria bacterium]|nr:MAG: delta-aminolevulinic acid dehydratase [Gammaproteobacteria bacterium]